MTGDRESTDDERAGMAWWNSLSESERARWLAAASSAKPADAWAAFKATQGGIDGPTRRTSA